MSIILFQGGDFKLVAVDTNQVAQHTNTSDDASNPARATDVAKVVARYEYKQNPDEPWLKISNVPIEGITNTSDGKIFGIMELQSFTDPVTGNNYNAGKYVVQIVDKGTPVTTDSVGVDHYEYTIELIRMEDNTPAKLVDGNAKLGTIEVPNATGGTTELLIIPNSDSSSVANPDISGNVLWNPDTKETTLIRIQGSDGVIRDYDGHQNGAADGTAASLSTSGPYQQTEMELITDEATGQHYVMLLSTNSTNTYSYLNRYEVSFQPDPADPTGQPQMIIQAASMETVAEFNRGYYGFEINEDGSLELYPGAPGEEQGVITISSFTHRGQSYDSFVDYATAPGHVHANRMIVDVGNDPNNYISNQIRMADYNAPNPNDTTVGTGYTGGSAGGDFNRVPFAPCFTLGTFITTEQGEIAIEYLKVGDRVLTRDRGYQEIRWIGSRTVDEQTLKQSHGKLTPIRIKQGAMGENMPNQDMIVSPQHRMLLETKIVEHVCQTDAGVFATATQLAKWGFCGVEKATDMTEVTYMHLLCDQHEVLRANGAWTESLLLGPQVEKDFRYSGVWDELVTLFPSLVNAADYYDQAVLARPVIQGKDLGELIRRHSSGSAANTTAEVTASYLDAV